MNNLKCLKQGFNGKLECKKDKNRIPFKDCKGCPYKEYKVCRNNSFEGNLGQKKEKNSLKMSKKVQIKRKSSKLAKLERERTSLFTDDLEHCIICGKSPVNLHEIFGGRNRLNSIKYKLVIPLCTCEHHNQVECKGIHFDKELRKKWHEKGQVIFEQTYPDLVFKDIFGRNYKKGFGPHG